MPSYGFYASVRRTPIRSPRRWVVREEKVREVIVKLRAMRLTKAAALVDAKAHETLTYFAFPSNHWRQIKTDNPLERIIREIRRRTRVVGAFPDGRSR